MNKIFWQRIFQVAIPLLLLLSSYYLSVWVFTPLDSVQQGSVSYVQGFRKELPVNFGSNENSHMRDVRQLMIAVHLLFLVLLFLSSIIYFRTGISTEQMKQSLRYAALCFGLILLGVFLSFDLLFELFHYLFFPQGNWSFPTESLLIQTFPQEFFVRISITLFGTAVALGLSLYLVLLYLETKKRKKIILK